MPPRCHSLHFEIMDKNYKQTQISQCRKNRRRPKGKRSPRYHRKTTTNPAKKTSGAGKTLSLFANGKLQKTGECWARTGGRKQSQKTGSFRPRWKGWNLCVFKMKWKRFFLSQWILRQTLHVYVDSSQRGVINVLACLYRDVFLTEGTIRFNVMDQFVSVWMKREKKFQEREFIGIKPSTARENCHSQLVTILDSFPNSDQHTISPHKLPNWQGKGK